MYFFLLTHPVNVTIETKVANLGEVEQNHLKDNLQDLFHPGFKTPVQDYSSQQIDLRKVEKTDNYPPASEASRGVY